MSSSLNIQLATALRRYVDDRASDKEMYATPGDYIRDLIRRDMEGHGTRLHVLHEVDDLKNSRVSSKSILDVGSEE